MAELQHSPILREYVSRFHLPPEFVPPARLLAGAAGRIEWVRDLRVEFLLENEYLIEAEEDEIAVPALSTETLGEQVRFDDTAVAGISQDIIRELLLKAAGPNVFPLPYVCVWQGRKYKEGEYLVADGRHRVWLARALEVPLFKVYRFKTATHRSRIIRFMRTINNFLHGKQPSEMSRLNNMSLELIGGLIDQPHEWRALAHRHGYTRYDVEREVAILRFRARHEGDIPGISGLTRGYVDLLRQVCHHESARRLGVAVITYNSTVGWTRQAVNNLLEAVGPDADPDADPEDPDWTEATDRQVEFLHQHRHDARREQRHLTLGDLVIDHASRLHRLLLDRVRSQYPNLRALYHGEPNGRYQQARNLLRAIREDTAALIGGHP